MAHRRRSFIRDTGRIGRLTEWIGPADQEYVAVASAGATLVASAPFESPGTIMRTRGHVSIRPEVVSADLSIVGAFGIGIVTSEALAVGVTAVPHPFRDADWGNWYVWRSFSYREEFQTAASVNFLSWDFEVDSKAMRKVRSNESFVMVAESQTGAFRISAPLRTLFKNP